MKNDINNNNIKISVEKDFDASAEFIFNAWLNKNLLAQWMFGPQVRNEEIMELENYPEPGGTFSYVVKRSGEVINHTGTYLDMIAPTRLIFTWGVNVEAGAESVVTITIEPRGAGCRLTLVHEMDIRWSEYAERTEEGWTYMLSLLSRIHPHP